MTNDESPTPLVDAITRVASCPCAEHQAALLASLALAEEFLFKQVTATHEPNETLSSGAKPQTRLSQVDVAGEIFILALPDLATARQHDPNATFVGIPRDEAFQMALRNSTNAGILFISATADDAWAAVSRKTIADLLRKSVNQQPRPQS